MPLENLERLQKILASAGIASRRAAEEMILEGRVTVNGRVVTRLGSKADPGRDDIRVDGQRVGSGAEHVYVMLNKPRGVLSIMEDDPEHPTLKQYVTLPQRLYPVGRLDVASEGLILLTDDGELANRLTHPRYAHDKEYRVTVNGRPSEETLDAWRRGVMLEERRTAPARVDLLRVDKEGSLLRVVMREGRKRQIRRVAAMLGHPVRQLVRVRLGPLQLGMLEPGLWRFLTEQEVADLTAVKEGRRSKQPKEDRRMGPRRATAGESEDRPRGTAARRRRIEDGRENLPREGPARRGSTGADRGEREPDRPARRQAAPDDGEGPPRGKPARRQRTRDEREEHARGTAGARRSSPDRREDRSRGAPVRGRDAPGDRPSRSRGKPARRRSTRTGR